MSMKSTLKIAAIAVSLGGFVVIVNNNFHLRRTIDELKTAKTASAREIPSVELSICRVSTPAGLNSQIDTPICFCEEEADKLLLALESRPELQISRFPQTKVGSGLTATFEIKEDRLSVVPTIVDPYTVELAITTGSEAHKVKHPITEDLWTGQTLVFRSSSDPNTLLFVKAVIGQG